MSEFKSNMKYAKSVGADIRKPRKHTSQLVTDKIKALTAERDANRETIDALADDLTVSEQERKQLKAKIKKYEKALSEIAETDVQEELERLREAAKRYFLYYGVAHKHYMTGTVSSHKASLTDLTKAESELRKLLSIPPVAPQK